MIIATALGFALGAFGFAMILNLLRLATAPTLADRILAMDTMTVNAIAIVILGGLQTGSTLTFETAVLFALTGFISTVAFCKYLLRGSIIE